MQDYYKKFYYFFNDIQGKNFAPQEFIRKIFSQLDCMVFVPGSRIISQGEYVTKIYFLHEGGIHIVYE